MMNNINPEVNDANEKIINAYKQNRKKYIEYLLNCQKQKLQKITRYKQDSISPGVQIYQLLMASKKICKSQIKVNKNYKTVSAFLLSMQNRKKLIGCDALVFEQEKILDNIWVERHVYQIAWPLPNRQFVLSLQYIPDHTQDQRSNEKEQGEIEQKSKQKMDIIVWKSLDYIYPTAEQQNQKGIFYIGGFIIQQINDQQSMISCIVEAGLGNEAAQMHIRTFMHNQVRMLNKINLLLAQIQQK